MGRFDGKVAMVTGGARGQGRSPAVCLAREGADVAVLDICGQILSVEYPLAEAADLDETSRAITATGRRALTIEPQDVSEAVLWLLSDEARYVTGVVLPIDAGLLLV